MEGLLNLQGGPWKQTLRRLFDDRLALLSLFVVIAYGIIAIFVTFEWLPIDWSVRAGEPYSPPSSKFLFGTDFLGREVFAKVLYGAKIAFSVGVIASAIAIPIGAVLGATAGYFGGKVDEIIVWLYSTVASIPGILLLISISFVLGRGLTAVYVAIGLTSWVGICRIIRSEVMKLKEREYVIAARALGAGHARRLFRHILPNVMHLIIIDFSLRFVYAIKSEVILSYLGLGVQGQPSWGIMIADSKEELLRGIWWQLAAATAGMFFLVLALNILGDALRDALDPRLND